MPAIKLHNIEKKYLIYNSPRDRLLQALWRGKRRYFREHEALKPVTLEINKGETVGIIGVNGSGKSTMLQIICGTLSPSAGEVVTHGRISALLELGAGFNPDFSGRENIILNASILGLSEAEINERYDDIVSFSGLDPAVLSRPVHTYSSGMYVRLAFAVAISVNPDILIVDEALAVGDEAFQRKCFARIRALQENGTTILFVSHSSQSITDLCSRAILLDAGELLLDGLPKEVVHEYHKLIYAAPEQRNLLREAIKNGTYKQNEPLFEDKTVLPESMVEYTSRGAKIIDPHLEKLSGERVNLLETGKEYIYTYNVEFLEAAEKVRCGMLIKSKSGFELGGCGTSNLANTIEKIEKGATLQVSFRFTCNLREGTYYINAGASAVQNEEVIFLHRIIDACSFRVLPDDNYAAGGMINFSIIPKTKYISPMKKTPFANMTPPLLIGATGGSGTRAVQSLIADAGYFMGENLPDTRDAHFMLPYLDNQANELFSVTRSVNYSLDELPAELRAQHADRILQATTDYVNSVPTSQNTSQKLWGWKQPRNILLLPFWKELFPEMTFLHVIRDGRDMAYSGNQNLPYCHYEAIMGEAWIKNDPACSIRLWNKINLEAKTWCEENLDGRYYILKYEDLCAKPEKTIRQILDFLQQPTTQAETLAQLIKASSRVASWKNQPTEEIEKITELGLPALKMFGYE